MDIIMPGQNGIEAAERIKNEVPSTKVILYSMYDYDIGSLKEMAAADHFIPKQRLFKDLIQTIGDICSISSK